MKYADDLVLLAKEQTLLQGLEDINMEKNYDTDNLKVTILEHTVLDQKKKKKGKMWNVSTIWLAW